MRWMYENKPAMAAQWEEVTQSIKRLPEHVKPKKKKKKGPKRKKKERK